MAQAYEHCRHCRKVYKTPRLNWANKPKNWRGTDKSYNDCLNERQDFCGCQAYQPGDKKFTPRAGIQLELF
jgi:hypothetical protein